MTLYVDEIFTYPGIGEAGVSSTDTSDPLYIGGVPGEKNCFADLFYIYNYALAVSTDYSLGNYNSINWCFSR